MTERPCRSCEEPERMHGLVCRLYTADNPPPLCLGYEPEPLVEGVL